MMGPIAGSTEVGAFIVHAVNGRSKSEWEWANEIADKLLFIGETAPPGIREQAHAFKDQIRMVVAHNLAEAIRHERIWCAGLAEQHGAPEAAAAIRSR